MADSKGGASSSSVKEDLKAKVKDYLEQFEKGMGELKQEEERGGSVKAKTKEMMVKFAEWSVEIAKEEHRETVIEALEKGTDNYSLFLMERLIGSFKKYLKVEEDETEDDDDDDVLGFDEMLTRLSEVAQQVIATKD